MRCLLSVLQLQQPGAPPAQSVAFASQSHGAPLRRRAFACLGRMHSLSPLDKRRFCLHSIPNCQTLATAAMELVGPPQRESTAGFLSCPARDTFFLRNTGGNAARSKSLSCIGGPRCQRSAVWKILYWRGCIKYLVRNPLSCLSQNLFADGKLYTEGPVGAPTKPVP
jgi:hypothetical protein